MRKVYEMEPCTVNPSQIHHIEQDGTLWRYRQQITVGHLMQHLSKLSSEEAEQFKLLQLFLEKVSESVSLRNGILLGFDMLKMKFLS